MTVYETIKALRAVRQFSTQTVERIHIEHIANAGRLSGSAKNSQPWTFVAVTDRPTLQRLAECGPWCAHVAGAAFAFVLVVNDLQDPPTLTAPFDLGRAAQNMMLAAWELGIGSVVGTIYAPDIARAALGIPDDKDVPWLLSFGYPHPEADPRQRPPRQSGRRRLREVLMWERWASE